MGAMPDARLPLQGEVLWGKRARAAEYVLQIAHLVPPLPTPGAEAICHPQASTSTFKNTRESHHGRKCATPPPPPSPKAAGIDTLPSDGELGARAGALAESEGKRAAQAVLREEDQDAPYAA